jgi:hypothetical protein
MTAKETYYALLQKKFIQKAKQFHTNKFINDGKSEGDFDLDSIKDSFRIALENEIQASIKDKVGKATILDIIRNGFKDNAKVSTLDVISKYVGYPKGFSEFYEMNKDVSEVEVAKDKTFFQLSIRNILDLKIKKWILSILGATLLFFVGTKLYPFYVQSTLPTDTELIEVVKNSNRAEFNAYKKIPVLSTKEVEEFTTGIKKTEILTRLNKRRDSLWVMNNEKNPSEAMIYNFSVKEKKTDLAKVITVEHWKLHWFDTKRKEYRKPYDQITHQEYLLIKENGKWKVTSNDMAPISFEFRVR